MTQTFTPLAHVYGCSCRECIRERRKLTRQATLRTRGTHHWHQPHERRPCGEPGNLSLVWHPNMGMTSYRDGAGKLREFPVPDITDVLAWQDEERPWLLTLWEPLPTKAPGPHLVRPHCCYIDTVIFYARPYQALPPTRYLSWHEFSPTERHANGNPVLVKLDRPVIRRNSVREFATYGRLETRLRWACVLGYDGEEFEYAGGTVVWARPNWWMRHRVRRKQKDRH